MRMVQAAAQPCGTRWPAWRIVPMLVVGIGVGLLWGRGVAAAQVALPESLVHPHAEGQGHDDLAGSDVARRESSEGLVRSLIAHVQISDAGLQPSAVFVPAGRPVQLVLRGRDRTEHHYRVVGLVPDELYWVAAPQSTMADVSGDEHNHHDRAFARSRDASPAGIRPSGDEVHAYVSPLENVDVVFFSTTQTGTFVVRCDLHAKDLGRLVVFDAGGRPTALISAAGNAQGLARDPLSVALSRDLGTLESPGTPGVFMEATYAPAEYVTQLLGGPVAMPTALEPDQYVAILLSEGVHTGRLPVRGEAPALYVDGEHLPLIDSKVTTELPHHRATLYRFARDDAFGTKEQVMTLRLAPGHEATWELSSPNAGLWFVVAVGLAGTFGFAWWLVSTVAGRARRSKTMNLETP